jgi:L-aspartate oxidase
MRLTGAEHILLDMRHLAPGFVARRFPRIFETCMRYNIDLEKQPAPVHPAAHYAMGGVRTDLMGRTNLPRLFAAGEVACTGVHGANRLASNSLLEGVVFGRRAGLAMLDAGRARFGDGCQPEATLFPSISEPALRELTWRDCGIIRSGAGLREACEQLNTVGRADSMEADRLRHEVRNIHVVANLIARCALAREESRGGHYREDFPEKRPAFQKHSLISKTQDEVDFE